MTNDHCIDQIRGPQFCAPSPRHCWSYARRDHQPPHAVVKCDGAVTGLFDDSDGKLAHIGAELCALRQDRQKKRRSVAPRKSGRVKGWKTSWIVGWKENDPTDQQVIFDTLASIGALVYKDIMLWGEFS
ncbi:MAG: hypothetical protein ACI81Q_000587 [Paracoccaceae bacterium]|jgi:hypothetical protein